MNFWQSVFSKKCPRCRKGNLFEYPDWKVGSYLKMHENCTHCGQHFTPEPGFYIGAIYIAYAMNVAIIITGFTALSILSEKRPELWLILTVTITPVVLLFPFVTRLSRSMMLHFFGNIDYEG